MVRKSSRIDSFATEHDPEEDVDTEESASSDEDEDEEKPRRKYDSPVYDEVYDPENWEGVHPAEVAAKLQRGMKSEKLPGGSDEAILKDLRKDVFSVPLMPQVEVHRLFTEIDSALYPVVYKIIETSDHFFEHLIQVVVKVAAGNTYGKNIYEKTDNAAPETGFKVTYKTHEIDFLNNAYSFLKLFARSSPTNPYSETCEYEEVRASVENCNFIRGVYEEILNAFLAETDGYIEMSWAATKAKLDEDYESLSKLVENISEIETKLRLRAPVFGLVNLAREVVELFASNRSKIIQPYLRSVYSAAKGTAKNAHQMLDNFQNGAVGLIRAISCYSTRRPASFASVAKWWIKQMMLLSIKEDANFVKLPVSTWQAYTQLEKAKAKIGSDDIEAIAKAAKMPAKKAKAVYHTIRIAQVFSLNRTYDSEEKLTLEDIMTNESKLGHRDTEYEDLLRDYCQRAGLTDGEMRALALRHGMPDILENSRGKTPPEEVVREAVVQNLARLGYSYRYREHREVKESLAS
jgi:DNA-directed RNA polymerase sigma subunit (sigma70/sigma32)